MAVLQQYKCPCCDGAIEFDSTSQKMVCPYCDTEFDVETLKGYDDILKTDHSDNMEWSLDEKDTWTEGEAEGMRIYVCNSCGGEIVGDENTVATACPFCGNPTVMMGNVAGTLRPDFVIPFKLTKDDAKRALTRHMSGKRLLPKLFRSENRINEIRGIYVPFWLFDTEADAGIRYKATTVRAWREGNYDCTETCYYAVYRAGKVAFDNIPVDGSTKMADDIMESIEPFDFREAVDFQTAYLSGYLADKYDVSADDSIPRVNDRVKRSTAEAFAETVTGYSTVMAEDTKITIDSGRAKYALYPVWLLNTKWQDKVYTFAMNGQTGKFVGDLPVDKGLWWKWFLISSGIASAALTALSYVLWMMGIL